MQRPTPLSAPPRAERQERSAVETEAVPRPAEVSPDAVTGPIPQIDVPSTRSGEPDEGPDQESAVSLRDVWRAARARRRALRGEVRRFTTRARRRRLIWIASASAMVLLVAGTLGAAYSPLFAVERITIIGAKAVDPAALQKALGDQLGTPLPLVDESVVKAALIAFPLVETYRLEARPPHELVVQIVERTPVGVVESAAGYTVVDAAGVALSTTSSRPDGQPLIAVSGGTETAAFEAVGQVLRSLPESIAAQVTKATALTPDDVTLTLADSGSTIVWGSAEESALKALVLETTMTQKPPRSGREYDVSSPHAVVIR